jgi:hypothetical protein
MVLYFENTVATWCFGVLLCECFHGVCRLKRKRTKLMAMYELGSAKLEKELDVIKLIRSMKNMRIYLKSKFLGDLKEVIRLEHHKKNLLPLDDSVFSGDTEPELQAHELEYVDAENNGDFLARIRQFEGSE